MTFSLDQLNATIGQRASAAADESYTAALLEGGVDKCARKFGEEAIELVVAAVARDQSGLAAEAADVLFHLLVLLKAGGVSLPEVMAELERRTGQSGLAEKASRGG